MADVLRKLLDGGKLSDENCRLILRGLGKQVDELHLSKNKAVDEWSSDEEEEVDEEYCRQVKESLGFDIDMNVRIPEWGIAPYELGDYEPPIDISLYGRLGVHCFNFEKGRNLRVMRIPKYNIELAQTRAYYITMEVEDLADNSSVHTFQTLVTRCFPRNNASLVVFTGICRLKPETPGEGDADARLDEKAINEFYKGSMPDFLSQTKLDDKLRFYEVQEQDICENDWLRLYTEFALFCFWWFNEDGFKFSLPVEIKKIIVETHETDGEPCHKLKSGNAIFYINFRAKSRDYRSVVRRKTDGKTGHIILEINCWDDQPSPALTENATK